MKDINKTDITTRRKLKKRNNNTPNESQNDSQHTKFTKFINSDEMLIKKSKSAKKPIIVKKRKIIKYKQQKCAFVYADGHSCKNLAVGKSTLCKQHGGDPVIKENFLDPVQEKYLDYPNSKFNPSVHPISYIALSKEGASDVEIAAEFEVAVDTLKKWAERYESFNTAFEVGKAMHEAWWLREGKNNLSSRNFNTNLFKYLTMNKLGYSDKIEQKSMNMNVHGVLVIPDKVTPDEWESEEVIDVN